jgi:4-amino-4-deoxy-L-arabinose transferase-like glycosyltransferase
VIDQELRRVRPAAWIVFLLGAVLIGGTVAGPGLTWDEPAYRGSQVGVAEWWGELLRSRDPSMLGKEQIDHYWEYNRFGPNFHPPMASYFNLASYGLFGWLIDDLSARRLASALQFAALAGILTLFFGSRWGLWPGVFAGTSLLFMPRLVGDAHVVGTDVTMLFFWTITALLFWKSFEEPNWRWAFGASAGCLFLTKFSGLVLVMPLAVWFLGTLWNHRQWIGRWIWISLQLLLPLLPIAIACLGGEKLAAQKSLFGETAKFVFAHDRLFSLLLLWPALRLAMFRRPADWPRALEIPWAALAVAPIVAAALNPTWWHDSISGLARYFDLNLHREGKLPNIGVFYLGERFSYSLPWHNGIVLLLVTVPFGVLALGLFGGWNVLRRFRTELLGLFVLLQTVTLIVFRMFPTPAHDGVRLFLPTFLFFAVLAAFGAMRIAANHPKRWLPLFLIGPVFSAAEWAWIHPLELSYYNVGLRNAVKLGFEATYWYDAVTPGFLKEVNEKLPTDARLIAQADELINSEVLFALQSKGRLRGDLVLNPPDNLDNWILLLTHSSKNTPFTRLLHAVGHGCLSKDHDGVRLVTLIDPHRVNVAMAAACLTVRRGAISTQNRGTTTLEPMELNDAAFTATDADWQAAFKAYADGSTPAGTAGELVKRWRESSVCNNFLPPILNRDRKAVDEAATLLTKGGLLHRALLNRGYMTEDQIAASGSH